MLENILSLCFFTPLLAIGYGKLRLLGLNTYNFRNGLNKRFSEFQFLWKEHPLLYIKHLLTTSKRKKLFFSISNIFKPSKTFIRGPVHHSSRSLFMSNRLIFQQVDIPLHSIWRGAYEGILGTHNTCIHPPLCLDMMMWSGVNK